MKKYLFLIFALVLNPLSAISGSEVCASFNPLSFLMGVYEDKCITLLKSGNSVETKLYCECLEDPKNNNYFKISLRSLAVKNVQSGTQELKVHSQEKLDRIYEKLNFGIGIQETLYEMNPKGGPIGCPPETLAEGINEYIKSPENTDKLKGQPSPAPVTTEKVSVDSCAKNPQICQQKMAVINSNWESQKNPKAQKSETLFAISSLDSTSFAEGGQVIDEDLGQNSVADVFPRRFDSTMMNIKPMQRKNANKQALDTLHNAKKFYNDFKGLLTTTKIDEIQRLIATITKSGLSSLEKQDRNLLLSVEQEYAFKVKFAESSSYEEAQRVTDIKALTDKFDYLNKDIQKNLERVYSTAIPEACVDYADYKILKSSPPDDLMAHLRDKSVADISSYLNPGSDISRTGIDFLRNNPLIAKIASESTTRNLLATQLKEFIETNNGKSHIQRLPAFINFMKTKVAKINRSTLMQEQLHCRVLGMNYTAMTKASPNIPESSLHMSGDPSEVLKANFEHCEGEKQRAKYVGQADANSLINKDPLLKIFNDNSNKTEEPATDHDYKFYLISACPDMKEFEESYKRSCKRSECEYLEVGSPARKKFLDAYFSSVKDAEETQNIAKTIHSGVNKLDFDEVAKKFNINKQNKLAVKEFQKNVEPLLKKQSVFQTEKIFDQSPSNKKSNSPSVLESLAQAQSSYNAKKGIPDSYDMTPEVGSKIEHASSGHEIKNVSRSQEKPVTNPERVIPSYLNRPSQSAPMNIQPITSVADARAAIEQVEKNLSPQNSQVLSKAKEYLEKAEGDAKEIASLKSKVAEMEQEIAKVESPATSLPYREPASRAASVSGTSSVISVPAANYQNSVKPVYSPNVKVPTKAEKITASMNDHLSRVADLRAAQQGIGLVEDMDREFDFDNRAPIQLSEIEGKALLVESPLSMDSEKFLEVTGDDGAQALKTYLKENSIGPDTYVKIQCSGNKCPEEGNEIVLHVSKEFKIRAVARDVAVLSNREAYEKSVRESKYDDLKFNMQDVLKN